MSDKEKKHPVKVFQCGRINAAIWEDQKVIDNTIVNVHTIKIDRSYKDGEDWVSTNLFFAEDLLKVALAANEAYKFLKLKTLEKININNNADS